jgi:hypothetical protein
MNLNYGISGTEEEDTINKLAKKIEAALKGNPSHLCMMALADVTARAMVEETADHAGYVEAFSSFMAIVAKEVAWREAIKRDGVRERDGNGEVKR